MSEQPEALQLTDDRPTRIDVELHGWAIDAELMLRRQHAEIERLRALNAEMLETLRCADAMLSGANMNGNVVHRKARAAIAKAEAGTRPV